MELTQENYYQDKNDRVPKYLSCSRLHNFVTYDQGRRYTSIQDFFNPPELSSDAVMVGKILDEILTEGVDFDEKYEVVSQRTGPKSDKLTVTYQIGELPIDVLQGLFDPDTVKIKALKKSTTFTIDVQKGFDYSILNLDYQGETPTVVFSPAPEQTKIQVTNSMYDAIFKAYASIIKAEMSPGLTLEEWLKRESVSTQAIFTDDDLMLKGKFDFLEYDQATNTYIITDLKCTGSIGMVRKELFWNGQPNLRHKWVRQMAWYQHLVKTNFPYANVRVRLAIVSHNGDILYKELGQRALDVAWQEVLVDIIDLRATLESGTYVEVLDIDAPLTGTKPVEAKAIADQQADKFIFQI